MNAHPSLRRLSAAALRPARASALLSLLALAASPSSAQVVTSGTLAIGGGGALLDGDRPAFQEKFRQKKDGYGGLEDFTLSRITDASLLRFEAKIIPGNEDYRSSLRFEKFDAYYLQADYKQFRTFYDGSGGVFRPRNLSASYFDEALALDRSFFSVEFGTLVPDRPQFILRYDRNTRDGTKNSIRWGESNLAGQPFVPRAYIPSYLLVDETRDIVTAELNSRTDVAHWKVAGRYERTSVKNRHVARRRIGEAQDRYVVSTDGVATDLFAGHGYYERIFNEKLRWSAGGLVTDIDTNLTGSKIYGGTPDPEYSATFARRQAGDVGYYGLVGKTRLKQYVGNLNAVYQPAKYWTIRPGVKYEHLRQSSGEDHIDTNFAGAALNAVQNQTQAASKNSWNELTEDLEIRFTRWSNVALDARAQLNQGTGGLLEQSILLPATTPVINRDTDYDRFGQRYTVNATWYARPGLTLAAQYNYRLKLADYRSKLDNTSNAANSPNRYPSYLIDQDIASHDGNVRLSWRPRAMLSFVTRYAHQQAVTTSTFENQPAIDHGRLTRHVVTQTATWNPTARLFLSGAVNVTYDQLKVPRHRFTMHSNNDYVNASLGAGYALGKVTDLYLDLNHYRADNYTDNSDVTIPLNAGQTTQSGFLTWVRRHGDRLIYTAKYGYATNRDGTFAGYNDYSAHLLYGKVQYKF